jgi:hypothetical protein
MAIWFALLVAPTLALADQVIAYAAVGWSCAHERAVVVRATHALFLVTAAASRLPAWRLWNATRAAADEVTQRRHFLGGLAIAVGALSVLAIAAMWMTTWFIEPCIA